MKGLRRGRQVASKRLAQGFTLIELLIVIGFLMALGVYQVQSDLRKAQTDIAGATATQLTTLVDGANAFSVNHYQELIGAVTPSTTGLTCVGTDLARRCNITIASLQADGLLPAGYVNTTAFTGNGAWNISYRLLGSSSSGGPGYNVEGLVISTATTPWTTDGSANAAKANSQYIGLAARRIGADGGGTIPNCGGSATPTFCSTGGAFKLTSTDYTSIQNNGQIGARVGTGTELFNAYLRRDGTLPMTGSLNMGGNSIYNMLNITGTGLASFGTIDAAGTAFTVDNLGRVNGAAVSVGPTANQAMLTVTGEDSNAAGLGVLTVTGSVKTPNINNSGGGVVIGASMASSAVWNGPTASSGANLSVDDIYIRKIGHWASEVASQYASRGIYLAPDGSLVVQPTCQQGGGASSATTGIPKIQVTAGDQVITTYLQQGTSVPTAGGTISLPAQETVGEFANYATAGTPVVVNGVTRQTWLIHVEASQLTGGATPRKGNYALAHVYCEFVLANNN